MWVAGEANQIGQDDRAPHSDGRARLFVASRLPLDDVVEELWAMLARGDLRLMADGERLRVERFNGSEVERLRLARTHRPIIEARWRMLSGNPA
jgi:hypothetical protein